MYNILKYLVSKILTSYVHLFLSNNWCNLLNITVLVIMHRIFIYNKVNDYLSYENLLMTRLYSLYIETIHLWCV